MSKTLDLDGEPIEIPTAYDLSWDTDLNGALESIVDKVNDLAAGGASVDGRLDTAETDIDALQAADTALDTRVDTLEASTHSAVTIGTANGLSLVGQALSLAAATASNAGAMSAAYADKLDGLYVFVPAGSSAATIQAAIDSLSGYGTVFLEKGTYALGATALNLDGHIIIQGAGQTATFVTFTGTKAFQINSGLGVETLKASIRDLTIDGTNAGSGGEYGIVLGQVSVSPFSGAGYFSNLTIKRCATAGVRSVYSPATMWFRCNFESNDDGFWTDPTNTNAHQHQLFFGCQFLSSLQRGCFLEQADQFSFYACRFEDNGKQGLLAQYPNNASIVMRFITLDNCYFEDNSTAAANTYPDLDFLSVGSFSHQNHSINRCRFQGANTSGNIHFNKGTAYENFCEFSPVATTNIKIDSSTVAFFYSTNIRDPATYITAGANAPSVHIREGNGLRYTYFNVAGTITLKHSQNTTGESIGHAGAPAYQLDMGTGVANTKLALFSHATNPAGFGIQSDDVRFHGTGTSKFSWRGTAAGASQMELSAGGVLTLTQPSIYKAATSITAFAGGGQASATALPNECNFVTTVASANDSVKLPVCALGLRIVVYNLGANSTNIYPQTSSAIDALGTNNAYALAAGGSREFWGQTTTQWRSK